MIHYTIDGTEPTEESPVYQEPIILKNGRTTVKAIAISSRGYMSETASASYTITVERKKVEFTDPAIENAVRNTLGLGYGDLYNEDVEQIRELTIVGYSVLQPGESALFDADSYTFQSDGWEQDSMGDVETLEDIQIHAFPAAAAYSLPGGFGYQRRVLCQTAAGAFSDSCGASGRFASFGIDRSQKALCGLE